MDGKSTLDHLYAAIHRAENKVGGGEGLVGIYGSMTQQGTENIMRAMAQLSGLDQSSILVDIGSGLCRPLLHATVQYGVHRTFGVELDAVKCQKAVPFLQHAAAQLEGAGVELRKEALPTVICASVEQLGSLDPATHAYAAWEGFPVQAKIAVGDLFVATPSLHTITIVQRSLRNEDPAEAMADLGFGPVKLLSPAIPVHMAGSHRRLNAYIFTKTSQLGIAAVKGNMQGNDAGKNHRARAGAKSLWEGGGSQAAQPSLSTATPFDPAAVMEALARMDGGVELATSRATGQATGRRSSSRATTGLGAWAAAGQGDKKSHGLHGPGVSQPLHSHGLRPNRKRSARALQRDVGTDEGEDGEGCMDGGGRKRTHGEGMCGKSQPEGLQRVFSSGFSSTLLVITTRRRSQRTSKAQMGSTALEPPAAGGAAVVDGGPSGGIGGVQQHARRRPPYHLQQERSAPATATGTAAVGPQVAPLAPLALQTRAAARQNGHVAASGQCSMPGSMEPAAYAVATTAAPAQAAQRVGHSRPSRTRLSERMKDEPQEPQQPAVQCASVRAAGGCGVARAGGAGHGGAGGSSEEGAGNPGTANDGAGDGCASRSAAEGRGSAGNGGTGVVRHLPRRAAAAAAAPSRAAAAGASKATAAAASRATTAGASRATAGGEGGGTDVGDSVGRGMGTQTQARSAVGDVGGGVGDGKGMRTRAKSAVGDVGGGVGDGKGMRTRARTVAGTVTNTALAAVMQPPGLCARAPLPVRAAQLPLCVLRKETKPKAAAAQAGISAKQLRGASAGGGHAGVGEAVEPAAKVRRGA